MFAITESSSLNHPNSELGLVSRYAAGLAFGVPARLFWQDWLWLNAKVSHSLKIKAE